MIAGRPATAPGARSSRLPKSTIPLAVDFGPPGAVFVLCSLHITHLHEPVVSAMPHLIVGTLLGFLLVLRVMIGVMRAGEVMCLITSYNKR